MGSVFLSSGFRMYIGQLSTRTGVSRKAIQVYERMGLLPAPKRKGRYRVYSQGDVETVHTIRYAQSLGFRLKELVGVLPAPGAPLHVERLTALIETKRQTLLTQIEAASRQERELAALRDSLTPACRCGNPPGA